MLNTFLKLCFFYLFHLIYKKGNIFDLSNLYTD